MEKLFRRPKLQSEQAGTTLFCKMGRSMWEQQVLIYSFNKLKRDKRKNIANTSTFEPFSRFQRRLKKKKKKKASFIHLIRNFKCQNVTSACATKKHAHKKHASFKANYILNYDFIGIRENKIFLYFAVHGTHEDLISCWNSVHYFEIET